MIFLSEQWILLTENIILKALHNEREELNKKKNEVKFQFSEMELWNSPFQ